MQLKFGPNVICLALALTVCASGAPSSSSSANLVVLESIKSPPTGFTQSSSSVTLTTETVTLRIQLAQNNIAGLEEELYAVSTPGGEKYGQHLSAADVASYIAPTGETTSLVNAWLQSNGLTAKPLSNAGDWVEVSLPVTLANEMLDAEFTTYEDTNGNQFIRTLSYSIPSDLRGHINVIHPTVNFPVSASLKPSKLALPTQRTRRASAPASCVYNVVGDGITPACLQDLYSIPSAPANSSSNSLWVSAFVGQYADHSDVSAFIAEYRPDIPPSVNTTFNVIEINGGLNSENSSQSGEEAILDLEYTVGLATGVPVTFLSVGPVDQGVNDTDFLGALLAEADYLVGLDTPPYVLTTSYGLDETFLTPALANSICNAYMQLGARGTSVIYASGDGGVSGAQGVLCPNEPFTAVFPAACPYVTSVGATQLVEGNTEEAAYFTSGGFSNIFPQPSYQASAVSDYLSYLGSAYPGLYNATGRGFPDVSADGYLFLLYWQGSDGWLQAGTSCASPTFASVISLVNDRLLTAGKSPLGFLNPFLYANPDALIDIITGSNPGCNTNGFNATTGWDPITGLGTPNFSALAEAAGV